MNFHIDKGVPIPPPPKYAHTGLTKVLRVLSPSESTFVPGISKWRSIQTTTKKLKKDEGLLFVVRKVTGGIRIWRVSDEALI